MTHCKTVLTRRTSKKQLAKAENRASCFRPIPTHVFPADSPSGVGLLGGGVVAATSPTIIERRPSDVVQRQRKASIAQGANGLGVARGRRGSRSHSAPPSPDVVVSQQHEAELRENENEGNANEQRQVLTTRNTTIQRLTTLKEEPTKRKVRLTTKQVLGQGGFGTVFLGLNEDTGELVAVKTIRFQSYDDSETLQQRVKAIIGEIQTMKKLNHANIVRYLGAERDGNELLIYLEYVPGGSLSALLAKFGSLNEITVRHYTRQILEGLAYLHVSRIVHRDIKGENVLLDLGGNVKLADFGTSKELQECLISDNATNTVVGTPWFMAPEIIQGTGHGLAVDIWSVGCTVVQLLTGKPPFFEFTTAPAAMYHIASTDAIPALPAGLSQAGVDFLKLCFKRSPNERPTAQQLLRHPFCNVRRDGERLTAVPSLSPSRTSDYENNTNENANQNQIFSPPSNASSSTLGGAGVLCSGGGITSPPSRGSPRPLGQHNHNAMAPVNVSSPNTQHAKSDAAHLSPSAAPSFAELTQFVQHQGMQTLRRINNTSNTSGGAPHSQSPSPTPADIRPHPPTQPADAPSPHRSALVPSPLMRALVYAGEGQHKSEGSPQPHQSPSPLPGETPRNNPADLDYLVKLHELHSKGLISDIEFNRKKHEILWGSTHSHFNVSPPPAPSPPVIFSSRSPVDGSPVCGVNPLNLNNNANPSPCPSPLPEALFIPSPARRFARGPVLGSSPSPTGIATLPAPHSSRRE